VNGLLDLLKGQRQIFELDVGDGENTKVVPAVVEHVVVRGLGEHAPHLSIERGMLHHLLSERHRLLHIGRA
jgi:hypothetical protein